VRLFLAINLPASVRRELLDATAPLRAAAPDLSWADESRVHLTLKFLGEEPEHAIEGLARGVDLVAYQHKSFAMRIGGIGAFPNFRRARVIWIGVAADPKLELLHHDIEVACEELGFPLEGRAFRPHLTLARVRDGQADVETMRQLSRAAKAISYEEDVEVRSIDIMHSQLGAGEQTTAGGRSAKYECLHSASLRAN
jgi:RNA 2',3'-cyclic 3'-phosphodiesterase